jgi:hypothetical protein
MPKYHFSRALLLAACLARSTKLFKRFGEHETALIT